MKKEKENLRESKLTCNINLSKIQSLPIIGREWEYRFYINLTFDDYTRYRQSIDAVRPLINDFKILGEYAEFKNETGA